MTVQATERTAVILSAAVALYYAVLGLAILVPESVYSGDIGVQYVQAQAILEHRFRGLDIPYPGEFLDPDRRFFPIRAPFVMTVSGSTQSIFPPVSALLQALGVGALGLRGMIAISVIAAWLTLVCSSRLAPPRARVAVVLALGLGSPLWFYAVSGWHHAAAMAAGIAAFMASLSLTGSLAPVAAGFSLGAGAALRDEVILLVPGVASALWLRRRQLRPVPLMIAAAVVALGLAAVIEVWWFDRPAAAHLRHAVHLLQRAFQTTDAANIEVPVLHPMTFRDRYGTVIQYWLLGYGRDGMIAIYGGGLALALVVRWRSGSAAGIFLWLVGVLWLVAQDFHELVTAPKWLAGLFRVAPYLVFALLPAPAGQAREPRRAQEELIARAALIAAAAYLVLAFAGVDTTGGKGLGPRLLLPLLPILTIPAVVRIRDYLRAEQRTDRWIGRAGALLVSMAVVMHTYGTSVAYYMRNRDDSSVILAIAASRERIVVADEIHTAQLLFPLYYRKIILLADSPEAASALGSMLMKQRLSGALLVSRDPERSITLPGLRLHRSEQIGRMSITHWVR
jgi:hypothetical protein